MSGLLIKRDAIFAGQNRVLLTRRWSDAEIALVVGCNPSHAGGEREDATTHWLNRWFGTNGFGGYDLMNLYPFVSSSPAECRRMADRESSVPDWPGDALRSNLDLLVSRSKTASTIVVCWGNIAWDEQWIGHVIEQLRSGEAPWPDLWCWGRTRSGAPKHPMARGVHRMTADTPLELWRKA